MRVDYQISSYMILYSEYRLPRHTLAITNRGDATAEDIFAIARAVRAGVAEKFGVQLVPEPVVVNGKI